MDGGTEAVTEAEELQADPEPETPSSVDDLDDRWDLDGTAPSVSSRPGGWACNVVATLFCLILSATVITALVFVFILKTPTSPLDDHGPVSVAVLLPESEEPQDSPEPTPPSGYVTDRKARNYQPWMDGRGDDAWDEDDEPRSFDTNMSAIEYLRKYGHFGRPDEDMDDVV